MTTDKASRPNYRIYDHTDSGLTHDIYAATLEEAIEAGREWIEDGCDWSGCGDHDDGDVIARTRTIELECEVGEIVRDSDGDIDEDATGDAAKHDCAGSYSDEEPECPVDEGWDFVGTDTAGMDDFGWRSHGGTRRSHYHVCRNTGIYRDTASPGCQRNPDEPLEVVTYRERDESSEAYIVRHHEDDDGFIPEWLATYLGRSPSARMTEEQAKAWVLERTDDDEIAQDEAEHAFAAIFGHRADDQERAEGLWSHCCARVTAH